MGPKRIRKRSERGTTKISIFLLTYIKVISIVGGGYENTVIKMEDEWRTKGTDPNTAKFLSVNILHLLLSISYQVTSIETSRQVTVPSSLLSLRTNSQPLFSILTDTYVKD